MKEVNTSLQTLLSRPPREWREDERRPLFLAAMAEEMRHHFQHCPPFRRYCQRRGVDFEHPLTDLAALPWLPVHAFKLLGGRLLSVAGEEVRVELQSSGTSGIPSTVMIDQLTAKRQTRAMSLSIGEAIGNRRRPFLFMDVDPKTHLSQLKARGAAVLGYLNHASEAVFCLEPDAAGGFTLNRDLFSATLQRWQDGGTPPVIFGFTYILYQAVILRLHQDGYRFSLPGGSQVLHIGGWKKLQDLAVGPEKFKAMIQEISGIDPTRVVDVYGFTEQMGVNYPDCVAGVKHPPAVAEVIVRDPHTFKPVADGDVGVLQFLTPIPHSYPGNSVLTDDLGRILGRDRCPCGREGVRFMVTGRVAKAEVRGCGDVMATRVATIQTPGTGTQGEGVVELLLVRGKHQGFANHVDDVLQSLESRREWLAQVPVEAVIVLVDQLAREWRQSGMYEDLDKRGLAFLCDWCRADSLRRIAALGLGGHHGFLDDFHPVDHSTRRKAMAIPKGLVLHWVAGNVPLIGLFVLVQSMVTKNINLVRAPSAERHIMAALLSPLRDLEARLPGGYCLKGADLLETLAVVHFPREHPLGARLSAVANVRVAWGGREAVESLAAWPRRYDVRDLFFGPKLSFMVIGREQLTEGRGVKKILRRVATDCSVFDQYACSSPHTIFVERGGEISPRIFAERLGEEMARALLRIPKLPPDAGTVMAIQMNRIHHDMLYDVWHSQDTGWTVLHDEEMKLADPCYSRVVAVRGVEDVMQTVCLAHADIQTIGLALAGERRLLYARAAALRGVCRLPDVGRMTLFEPAWDGLWVMGHMVRWVTLGGP
ncbi:MAG: Acyl protein synthase/acyl-CoA reductase RfbN [Magnetococcales bacterium]|nr:Acyl protein synthase/acyl-CoA reductase RfbN [Magnetococcales bacterium]HIJ84515.1 acyl-CoA reductase [Magnetococcales bacterium]